MAIRVLDDETREAVARKLYEIWSFNGGHNPDPPDWAAYESGGDLNGAGLSADSFREDVDAIAPFDTVESIARRMCMNNHQLECLSPKVGDPCTSATCIGHEDWADNARQIIALVRSLELST